MQYVGKFNRFIGAAITSFSPVFVLTNFTRDYATAGAIAYARYGGKVAAQIMRDTPAALASLIANDRGADTDWGKWRDRAMAAGGKISFMGDLSFRKVENKFGRRLSKGAESPNVAKAALAKAGKKANEFMDFVEATNSSVENAVRVACFKALVDKGFSDEKAALAMKNLTVNFNRGGQQKWTNSWWLFMNANIQGTANLASLFIDKDPEVRKRAWKMAGAVMAAGAANAIIGYALGGESDNGRNEYENIPDYVKQMNAVIPAGDGSFAKIPLPHGPNIIFNFGRMIAEAGLGKNFSALDLAAGTVANILDGLNAFGSDMDAGDIEGTILRNAAPAIAKPLLDVALNKDFAGRQIAPKNFPGEKHQKPDAYLHYPGVNPIFREIAHGVNNLTGGSEYKEGLISFSPEAMEHYFVSYLGGMAGIAQQTMGMARSALAGEKIEARQMPFASRFYGSVNPAQDRQNMQHIVKQAGNMLAQYEDLEKSGNKEEAEKVLDENYGAIKFYKAVTRIQNKLRDFSGKAKKMEKTGRHGEEAKALREWKKDFDNGMGSAEAKAWDKIKKAKTKAEVDEILGELNKSANKIAKGD